MKKLVALLIISILVLIISFTYIGRYIFRNFADINDYKKFPLITVIAGVKFFVFNDTINLQRLNSLQYLLIRKQFGTWLHSLYTIRHWPTL